MMNARNRKRRSFAAIAFAALAFAPIVAVGDDDYQYIISGDPVAASTNGTVSAASSGGMLESGVNSTPYDFESILEARFRTRLGSDGIALNSHEFNSLRLIVR
jgi:hypothetical protein